MARTIKLTSGSIFNGNPITFTIQPNVITGTDSDKNVVYPSFHRVIMEITCGMSGGNYEVIKMSAPVEKEEATESNVVQIDVSSALRTFRDSYEYTPEPTTYPLVKFCVRVYDEYMLNGKVHPNVDEIVYPAEVDGKQQYLCTLFGGFSDMERLLSNGSKDVSRLSRKPTSVPQIVSVGEEYVYTPDYTSAQALFGNTTLIPPTSQKVLIEKEGAQTINNQPLYALPSDEAKMRQVFRFINSFGVLESVSVPRVYSKKISVTSTPYAITCQETFNKFSRHIVLKKNDYEPWLFQTDPLNEDWLQWYLHEFIMSEYIWINFRGLWVPCTITPEEDFVFFDKTQNVQYVVPFTVRPGINGSPILVV